jgi:hypothetical protein
MQKRNERIVFQAPRHAWVKKRLKLGHGGIPLLHLFRVHF